MRAPFTARTMCWVAGAPAEIAGERFADVASRRRSGSRRNAVIVIRMPGVQKPHCSPCASWNASWRGLRRPRAWRKTLDGGDRRAVGLHREHQARADRLAVHQHGAGAAHAVLAADVGPGEPQLAAQEVAQQPPRFDVARARDAIDDESKGEADWHRHTTAKPDGEVKATYRRPGSRGIHPHHPVRAVRASV